MLTNNEVKDICIKTIQKFPGKTAAELERLTGVAYRRIRDCLYRLRR